MQPGLNLLPFHKLLKVWIKSLQCPLRPSGVSKSNGTAIADFRPNSPGRHLFHPNPNGCGNEIDMHHVPCQTHCSQADPLQTLMHCSSLKSFKATQFSEPSLSLRALPLPCPQVSCTNRSLTSPVTSTSQTASACPFSHRFSFDRVGLSALFT